MNCSQFNKLLSDVMNMFPIKVAVQMLKPRHKCALGVFVSLCLIVNAQEADWEALVRATRPEVRIHALQEMAAAKSTRALPLVLKALDDVDPFVRETARASLLRIGTVAIRALITDLNAPNPALRERAAHHLLNLVGSNHDSSIPIPDRAAIVRATGPHWCVGQVCLESWVRPVYVGPARMTRL